MATPIEKELAGLLKNVHAQFKEDHNILSGIAEQHKTSVEVADIFGVLTMPGVYYLLLPFQWASDAEKILNSPNLSEFCSDSRQALEVARDLGVNDTNNAKFVIAGGGSQLLNRRQSALAAVDRMYLKHNPTGVLNKVVHAGFCARFTKDCDPKDPWAFLNIVTRGGAGRDGAPENDFLREQLHNALYDVIREDLPNTPSREDRERINLMIAHVDGPEHGSYKWTEAIK